MYKNYSKTMSIILPISDSWEDFQVPTLNIPTPSILPIVNNNITKKVYNDEKLVLPQILTQSQLLENQLHEKELEIAFQKAKQKFIDYQVKHYYPTYNRMNTIGKKKTLEKINKELKGYKNAAAILNKLEILISLDTGKLLAIDSFSG